MSTDDHARMLGDDIRRIHDLPITDEQVRAVLGAIEGRGQEIAEHGTTAALKALSARCPDCLGVGRHEDDSHPGSTSYVCGMCGGHRVVPRDWVEDGVKITVPLDDRTLDRLIDFLSVRAGHPSNSDTLNLARWDMKAALQSAAGSFRDQLAAQNARMRDRDLQED